MDNPDMGSFQEPLPFPVSNHRGGSEHASHRFHSQPDIEENELDTLTIRELEHDPDIHTISDMDTRSHYSTTTATTTGQHLPNSSKTESRPSESTKDSLISPSARGRLQAQPPLPRRSDFGEYYPDGGWGWVVCGGVFVVQFLSHGLYLAGGTLMVEIMAEFETEESYTVWMCSLSYALVFVLSPLVVAVCRRKSPRLFALVGGLVAALACLFMSFSKYDHQFFVSETVVLPMGTTLTMSTAGVILGRYFRKRRECAEMLALCGSGVGMAVVSVFEAQLFSSLSWMRAMQALSGLMVPAIIAGSLYRSPNIYHPRRKAILHIKTLTKTKKQRRDFESRPPYFDISPLRMRAMQILMLSTATSSAGLYVPFLLLPLAATGDAIEKPSYNLILVFLGVAFAFGSLVFGLIVVRNNLHCMIARQYLCQLASFGCGVATLLFTLADEFDGYALYAWVYGLFCGGYMYSIRVFTYEQVTVKISERSLGYVAFAQGLPVLFGVPFARWLGVSRTVSPIRYGFVFAGIAMIMGSIIMFLMPWAAKHRSNYEVIQSAHLTCKSFEEDLMFVGMDVSDDCSNSNKTSHKHTPTNNVYNCSKIYNTKVKDSPGPWTYAGCKLGLLTDDERWSDIEAMTPMSPTDKVTEFLVHSQTMLQSFSQRHHIDLPNVKLEINNQYMSDNEISLSEDEIKDLTLQATVCRNSPHRRSSRSKANVTRSEPEPQVQDNTIDVHRAHTPGITTASLENSRRFVYPKNARVAMVSEDTQTQGTREKTTTV